MRFFVNHLTGGDCLPDHRQRIEPAAPKPSAVDFRVWVSARHAECRLLERFVLDRALAQHESARNRTHFGAGLAIDAKEVLGVKREYALQDTVRCVRQSVLQGRHRQRAVVGIRRSERTPAGQFHAERHSRVGQLQRRERESRKKLRVVESRQAVAGAAGPVAAAVPAAAARQQHLVTRHWGFKYASNLFGSCHTNGCKRLGFVEDLRLVTKGNVREASGAIHADHTGPEATQGKRNLRQVFALVWAVIRSRLTRCVAAELRSCGIADRGDQTQTECQHDNLLD